MHRRNYQNHSGIDWSAITGRLVYLPGAVILVYGVWLSLTF
jgi:hypothetical protein